METIGASHSFADSKQSSSDIMSLRLVEYSRIRPQPVQVKLQVCSGSSCKTIANFGVLRTLCLTMCAAIFAVSASGNRINFYRGWATVCAESLGECETTGFVSSGFLVCTKPGRKKLKG